MQTSPIAPSTLVKDLFAPLSPDFPNTFGPEEMVNLYADVSISELEAGLDQLTVYACGKFHDEAILPVTSCKEFGLTLLCGHGTTTRSSEAPYTPTLRSAASLVAISFHVLAAAGELPEAGRHFDALYDMTERLYVIDGAAFAAYRAIENPDTAGPSSVPSNCRNEKWEKLSLPVLRETVRAAENVEAPEAHRLLAVAQTGIRKLLRPDGASDVLPENRPK